MDGFAEPLLSLEQLFAKHNRDDRPDGQLCPSMSVGDVVILGETAYTVESIGWERVDLDAADLITDRSIVVQLPAGTSPLGRLVLLCQLAGLAVLLFGAGFWYLCEARDPATLDAFRLPHFLLLALNYWLFFGLFALLGFEGDPRLATLGSAARTVRTRTSAPSPTATAASWWR